jgi:hypothetical protein
VIPTTPCADFEPCCLSLSDIATHLLTEMYDAITECYPSTCAQPLAAYITFGNGDDGIVDSLVVAAGQVTSTSEARAGQMNLWRATFTIRLSESGWPTARIEGEEIVLPTPQEQQIAARHVFSMGEAMHRRLSHLMFHRALVPSTVRCSNATVGTMVPVPPSGGVVGWQVPVTVDLPWN